METLNLSEEGAMMRTLNENLCCKTFKPLVVQVIDGKWTRWSLADDGTHSYLRLTFSDGSHSLDGVIDKNIEQDLVQSGRLHRGSVVVLDHFFVVAKTLIITELHVIVDQWELIGEPVPLLSNATHTFHSDKDFPWASTSHLLQSHSQSQSQSPSSHKLDDPYWSAILDKFAIDMSEFTDWPEHTHLCPPSYFDDLFTKKPKALMEMEMAVNELCTEAAAALDFKNGEIVDDDEPSHAAVAQLGNQFQA